MKHAVLIRAALDGKEIQFRKAAIGSGTPAGDWKTYPDTRVAVASLAVASLAAEYCTEEYRIKPKEDVVLYQNLYACQASKPERLGTVQLVVDGETGKLKSVEIVK